MTEGQFILAANVSESFKRRIPPQNRRKDELLLRSMNILRNELCKGT